MFKAIRLPWQTNGKSGAFFDFRGAIDLSSMFAYQLLANEMGLAHWKVSVAYGVFQVIVGLTVLFVRPFGLVSVLGILATYSLAFTALSCAVRRHVAHLRTR